MIPNIDIDISTEIFKLVNFWKGFYEALKKFSTISGQYLQKGDNKIMTIYRQGMILYQKGICAFESKPLNFISQASARKFYARSLRLRLLNLCSVAALPALLEKFTKAAALK